MNQISDDERTERARNIPRFFVEHHAIAWVLLVLVIVLGAFSYNIMPKLKDPKISAREALVVVEWPGASANQVEALLTKRVEGVISQNPMVDEISSASRPGEAVINFSLDEYHVKDTAKEFDDVGVKLAQLNDLPEGIGPVHYFNDYGDTATLMLTVASPPFLLRRSIDARKRCSRLSKLHGAARGIRRTLCRSSFASPKVSIQLI